MVHILHHDDAYSMCVHWRKMADDQQVFLSLLTSLANINGGTNCTVILEKLYFYIKHKSDSIRPCLNNERNLDPLFDILQAETAAAEMAVNILEGIIDLVDDVTPFVTKYEGRIVHGLQGSREDVCQICLKLLIRLTANVPSLNTRVFSLGIIRILVSIIGHGTLRLSEMAVEVLLNICRHGVFSLLFEAEVTKEFDNLLNKSSTVKFRVYDFFTKLCGLDEDFYSHGYSGQIFNKLLSEIDSNDDLSQMVALEMLGTVASSGITGLTLIYEKGFLDKVKQILDNSSDDPMQSYLFCAAMTFVGAIAREKPSIFISEYPGFVNTVLTSQINDDLTVSVVCSETLVNLAYSDEGLQTLYSQHPNFKQGMNTFGSILDKVMNDIYVGRLLDALAQLFTRTSVAGEVSKILEKLYFGICEQPLKLFQKLATRPVREVRLSAFKVLKAIARYEWGEQGMVVFAGFLEYLLNRDTEFDKEGKELKYEIIQILASSTTSVKNLGFQYHSMLAEYVKEGPFYSQRDAAVSFEQKE